MATTTHHSIGEGCFAGLTVLLLDSVLVSVASLLKVVEDVLSDFGLLRGGRASEFVEVTIEPLVNLFVKSMVVVADLLGSLALLAGLGFSGSSVLVSAAHIDNVVSCETGEAGVDIS